MEDARDRGAFGSRICDLSDIESLLDIALVIEDEPLVDEDILLSPELDFPPDKLEGRGTPMLED